MALRGFTPAPVLALRTIKSETVVGLSDSVIADIENLYGESEEWMITGEYAVVQLQQWIHSFWFFSFRECSI